MKTKIFTLVLAFVASVGCISAQTAKIYATVNAAGTTLTLNDGVYNDKLIISPDALKEMLTPRLELGKMFGYMDYCYLWYKP